MGPLAIMGILGAGKYISDVGKEGRQRKLASATQRYSPWTHLQAGPVDEADLVGTGMQSVGTGLAMEQSMANTDSNKKLLDAQTNYYNSMATSPWMYPRGPQWP